MTIFWIAAAGLVCLGLAFVLPPLWRTRSTSVSSAEITNLPILQDQRRQLDLDLASGQLTPGRYQEALDELTQRVLEEASATSAQPAHGKQPRKTWAGIFIGVMVPAVALSTYTYLGAPQAMDPTSWQSSSSTEPSVDELNQMVNALAKRMDNEPKNHEGWTQLGRAYALMQRFEEASKANRHAIAISPPNAQLLVDQADVLALIQGNDIQGEPESLIKQALQIDPLNIKALAMAGNTAFARKNYSQAIEHWSKAMQTSPQGSEWANMLESSLAQARRELQSGGKTASPEPAREAASSDKAAQVNATSNTDAKLTGVIRLAPNLTQRVSPNDTLFIFARATQGPRMPLAILRATAKDLPMSFTLDDSTAMSPATRLSQFKQIIVGARISKTGEAMPQSGDLIGQSNEISNTAQDVEITINLIQK